MTARVLRFILGGSLAFMAVNAVGGGCYGLAGAKGVPVEWLVGSPFADYSVPSLILLIVVGGSSLAAAITIFAVSGFAARTLGDSDRRVRRRRAGARRIRMNEAQSNARARPRTASSHHFTASCPSRRATRDHAPLVGVPS